MLAKNLKTIFKNIKTNHVRIYEVERSVVSG